MNTSRSSLRVEQVLCIVAGWFWVAFMWGFWEKGVYALGINATLFSFLCIALLARISGNGWLFSTRNRVWSIPAAIMACSFTLYENPFFEIIHLMAFPGAVAWFFAYSVLKEREQIRWTAALVNRLSFGRCGSAVFSFGRAGVEYIEWIGQSLSIKKNILTRIIKGLLSLGFLLLIILPLLSAADEVFASYVNVAVEWIAEVFFNELPAKVITATIVTLLLFSTLLSWREPAAAPAPNDENKRDSLSAAIVLLGVLLVYFLFLYVQIERMWIDSLPLDFKTTEALVKTGFWQLMIVSIINILLSLRYYRKTNRAVRHLLTLFAATSLLLLTSAGHRLLLYVIYYGFSYEKFYAAYTVLFLGVLLSYLVWASIKHRCDVLKFASFLLLWMYTAAAVFPTEQFVLRANLRLARMEDSRIGINELKMLSSDVLNEVKTYYTNKMLAVDPKASECPTRYDELTDWTKWIARQEDAVAAKKWYEINLSDLRAGYTTY